MRKCDPQISRENACTILSEAVGLREPVLTSCVRVSNLFSRSVMSMTEKNEHVIQ